MPRKPPEPRSTIRPLAQRMPPDMDEAFLQGALRDQEEALARLVSLVRLLCEVHRTGTAILYTAAEPGPLKALIQVGDPGDLQDNLREAALDLEDTVLTTLRTIRAFMDAGPPTWAATAAELERSGNLPAPSPLRR